jgi:hypothetical protein
VYQDGVTILIHLKRLITGDAINKTNMQILAALSTAIDIIYCIGSITQFGKAVQKFNCS